LRGRSLSATGNPTEALAAYEAARAIFERLAREGPTVTQFQADLANSHTNIGKLLFETGTPAEALASSEAARAIRGRLAHDHPTVMEFQAALARSHNGIGALLGQADKPGEALASFEESRAILEKLTEAHPESPDYASALGATEQNMAEVELGAKRLDEARGLLREAIRWQGKALAANPRHPQYRQFLTKDYRGLLAVAKGLDDAELAAEAERGLAGLASSDPRLQALDARLAAVLQGEAPRDDAERLELAQRAYDTRRFALAAKLWSEALAADPRVAADRQKQHPYNAACAAALAASGQGITPPSDDEAKLKLRQQALAWLKGELAAWLAILENGPAQARPVVARTLQHWKVDADLAGVRDEVALAALPEDERKDWESLWADVDALLALAAAGPQ
jgi:tetratricopeptide (TPR) repeat protein